MNTVLLHDWLTGFRGGERVLEAFCEIFPNAPIHTLIYSPGTASELIERHSIHTSFLNSWPGVDRHYRKLLPLFPTAAERLRIDQDTDLVLSSCHCVIKGVPKPLGAVHVSYVHSTIRYMYDQYDAYFGPDVASMPVRIGAALFRGYLVNWDKRSNANVDYMIANSKFVRERIRKFYERDAEVIYPFVDLADFSDVQRRPRAKKEHFVMVTAFAPNKRVDLAVEAFNELKLPLKIIGGGQLEKELRAKAGPNIEFLGNVSREVVVETLAESQALIFPGVEDFGITPLEALAARTPVIAYKAGGVLETLSDENTVFFEEASPKSLAAAVRVFQKEGRQVRADSLERFSRERFQAEIRDFVDQALSSKRA